MQINRKVLAAVSFLAIAGAAVGTTSVFAQNNTGSQTFVSELAQKLGIDQSKVQTAFDQIKQEHQGQMQANFSTKLDQLVKDGKLTDAQKQAFLAEMATLKSKYKPEALKDMTPAQRKQYFMDEQNELKSWAQSQGIDLPLIKPEFGMGKMGMRMPFRGHWKGLPNPSPSPTTP